MPLNQRSVEPAWCRHDKCQRNDLHEAHEEDFAKKPRKYSEPRTKAERIATFAPSVIRREGTIAIVRCPMCTRGCEYCVFTGEVTLFRWHVWLSRRPLP